MTARAAFLFDPDRCTCCEACRIACGIENGEGRDTGWRTLTTFNPSRHPALPTRHLSLACNHCDTPACALACPAKAYQRDPATGALNLDPEKCIGCRYCSWVCPYDAPKFDRRRGVMTKCTFCSPRLAAGGEPACTQACPTGALALGAREQGEPESVSVGLGATGLGPSLKVNPPRRDVPPPTLAVEALAGFAPSQPLPARKTTLGSEWALALFTLAMPALVGWFGGGLVNPTRAPAALLFLALGALAMGLSTAHLGRPRRAWRAILNLRTSWLSREVVLGSAFLGLATACLVFPQASPALGLAGLLAGIGLCLSIDRVYRSIPRSSGAGPHSAEALLTAPLLLGVVAGAPWLAWAAAAIKVLLFAARWNRQRLGIPAPLALVRLVLLATACLPALHWALAFAMALAGEALDRASFYEELEPSSPARRMAAEMSLRLARRSPFDPGPKVRHSLTAQDRPAVHREEE